MLEFNIKSSGNRVLVFAKDKEEFLEFANSFSLYQLANLELIACFNSIWIECYQDNEDKLLKAIFLDGWITHFDASTKEISEFINTKSKLSESVYRAKKGFWQYFASR